jgi:hypothetical protein
MRPFWGPKSLFATKSDLGHERINLARGIRQERELRNLALYLYG